MKEKHVKHSENVRELSKLKDSWKDLGFGAFEPKNRALCCLRWLTGRERIFSLTSLITGAWSKDGTRTSNILQKEPENSAPYSE